MSADLPSTADNELRHGLIRVTEELRSTLRDLQLDTRLVRLAGDDLPDAATRLSHVVALTERAAHHTLDLVEQSRQLAVQIEQAAQRDDDATLFRARVARDATRLRENLTEITLAQGYQDLTGQIIRKVVAMVGRLETALLELLRAAGYQPTATLSTSAGLAGPAVPGTRDLSTSQSEADDLMSGLGL